jgi:hypothetical protein
MRLETAFKIAEPRPEQALRRRTGLLSLGDDCEQE